MIVEHIGIAVRDLSQAVRTFEKILGKAPDKVERVDREGVEVAFFQLANGTKIELLAPTRDDSAIARFIDKRGEGIHHIAFEPVDLPATLARLRPHFEVLYDPPRPGADRKVVTFLHPRGTHGVLVEFCAPRPEDE